MPKAATSSRQSRPAQRCNSSLANMPRSPELSDVTTMAVPRIPGCSAGHAPGVTLLEPPEVEGPSHEAKRDSAQDNPGHQLPVDVREPHFCRLGERAERAQTHVRHQDRILDHGPSDGAKPASLKLLR